MAQVVGQYPAGILTDRFGRQPMMLAGLLVHAAAVAAFVLPIPVVWMLGLRFVQGLGAAAFAPGSRAAVADLVPAPERGVVYGWLSGAQMSGLIVGPALGGLLAGFGRGAVFEVTAVAMLAAAAVVALALRPDRWRTGDSEPASDAATRQDARVRMAYGGVFCVVLGIGFLFGIYDAIWSLFMRSIGATDWQVGASFSLFALPLVAVAPLAGWASDRWDRRWLATISGGVSAIVAPVYPFLHNIPVVLAVGAIEGAAAAFADPALNGYLMDAVPPAARGRAQGAMGTMLALATASGAVLGGLLFTQGVAAPFVGGAAVSLVSFLLALPFFRSAGEQRRALGAAGRIGS